MRKGATTLAVLLLAFALCTAQAVAARKRRAMTSGAAANLRAPNLPVTGASLMLAGARTPLWSYRGNAELPIASTTKMMTALVVLQHVRNLDTLLTQNDWRPDRDDSQIGLIPGERMSVHDLLLALMLPSADDAAEDLAYNVGGGSVGRFVAWMNADARRLGLHRTHYTTPIGLDTPGNYSSPDDLLRLADHMMRHWPFFRRTVRLASATLTSGRYVRHIVNTDDLLDKAPWIDGVKTGHTLDAGYLLVSEGHRHGLTLLASVLGTTSEHERDASALRLLDWGFSEFRVVRAVRPGQLVVRRRVPYESLPATIVAARSYRTVVARGTRITLSVGRLRRLAGPMDKGTVVGQLSVNVAGRTSATVPLILSRRLPAVSELSKVGHLFKRPFTLLMLALLLGGGAAAVTIRRRRRPRVLLTGPVEER